MRDQPDSSGQEIQASDPSVALGGPGESELHAEHEAALEATLFFRPGQAQELVLELTGGQLRLVKSNR